MLSAAEISFGSINLYAFPPTLVGALIFLLGCTTLFFERRLRISGSFFLLTSSAALWLLSYGFLFAVQNPTPGVILFLSRTAHIGVSLIPGFILLFISSVVRTSSQFRKWSLIGVMLSFIFCFLNLKTSWWVRDARHYFWGFYPSYGYFAYVFLTFFFAALFSSLFMLWKGYRSAQSDRAKGRLKALLIAFAISGFASVDYLANFGIEFYPFGYVPIFFFIVLTADTMRRYHLSDVTPAFAAEKILETMRGVVLGIDLDGIIRMANRSACEILGYEKSEFIGMPAKKIMSAFESRNSSDDIPLGQHLLSQAGASLRDHPTQWISKNGRLINFSVSASVMRGRAGDRGDGILYVAQDLTELMRREEILKESEDRYRSVTESANDAIISADEEGHILSWNRGAIQMFGYRAEEVLKKPITVLMPEKCRAAHRKELQRVSMAKEAGVSGNVVELIGLKKNGEEFPIELSLSNWKSNRGTFFSGIIRDITQRKRLQAERDRYFTLSLDMLCIADLNGNFRQLNPAWEKILGWPIEELMLRSFFELAPPEDQRLVMSEFDRLKAGESTATFESRCYCENGEWKFFLWSMIRAPGESLIYAAARDISGEKRNRQMRLRLASIVETSNDAILIVSGDGEIRSWNRGAEKIYGYAATEAVGKSLSILFPANQMQDMRAIIKEVIGEGGIENYETVGLKKDGVSIHLSLTISPIKDTVEHQKAISLIGRNITKMKEAEEVLRHRKDLEMKSNFISMVSHELRTPLSVIKMSVDILNSGNAGELTPKQLEWVDMCSRNASRLARLIAKVLDFQKLESGRIVYDFIMTDLNPIVLEVEKSICVLMGEKPILIKLDLASNLPLLKLDPDKITEVLTNILDNAVKFTSAGTIFVKTEALSNKARIAIRDTGMGIKKEDISKLFSSFTQVHSPEHRIGGSGLGLAISKKIIEQHGGQIWAQSIEGQGTTFFIELPCA